MGSQGYPVQAYTRISDGFDVFQVLDDGTLMLISGTKVIIVDGDPNGIVTAPLGSLAVDFTTPDLWQNQDAATTWKSLANPAPPPPSGVASFNTRTGAVVSAFDDYAAVVGLTLGDGGFSFIQFLNGNTIELRGVGAKTTRITLDGLGGTVAIVDGVNSNITFDGAGNIAITSVGGVITLNGGTPLTTPLTLLIFANNAAAITGGLAVGDLYRTGADPDVVCVVH